MKTILITGCSTGIGYATALFLREKGWHVIASCRQAEDVVRLTAEGFECYQLDIDAPDQIKSLFTQLANRTLHAIFCNAGYGQTGAVEDISRKALREQFETNVFGTWECIHYAMKHFRQQGYGRIIVNSSVLGFAGMPWRSAYNSSKFALEGLCDTLRAELLDSPQDIFVSLLQPGPIKSDFRKNALMKFNQHIDVENSIHKEAYHHQLERLNRVGTTNRFTLPAKSCAIAVYQALEAKKPKARYQVTTPTKLYWWLKRLLPTALLDKANHAGGNK